MYLTIVSVICSINIMYCNITGYTSHLPSIHEADEPLLLTKVVEHIVKPETYHFSKALRDYLEFLLLKTSPQPNAGLGLQYPCSCAIVEISVIIQDLHVPLLKALLTRDCRVTLADIQEGVKSLKKNQSDLLEVSMYIITGYTSINKTYMYKRKVSNFINS